MARIEDYALLGDLHTAALVSAEGAVDWMCLPRFDSPACFAALLADADAGRWVISPADGARCAARRYVAGTLVLETDWRSDDGRARVTDFMPPRGDSPALVRIVAGLRGSVTMRSELRLRFDYGRVAPRVHRREGGIEAVAGAERVRLSSVVDITTLEPSVASEITVRPGERVAFVLTWTHGESPAEPIDAEEALASTIRFWTEWSGRSTAVAGPHGAAVERSLITLKALTHRPTGGIVAAATTSLPEVIGGPRNWDYRYCWLRDSTYTLQALLAAGYVEEAVAWRDWLLRAVDGDPASVQIMYGVDGARRIPEWELPWLSGYEGSTPVRVGNAAAGQLQLDVWGETLDVLHLAREAGVAPREDAWDLQVGLMNHLEGTWREPDNGLWEVRGERRHFTHSKVLAWVAADRMARAVRRHQLRGPGARWERLRDTIHADVLEHGFDAGANTFVQSYGSTALDASLLLIPRVGFLPANDPRVLGTIDAIQRRLTDHGLVRRYDTADTDDGLPAGEGLFLACSFWLVDALHAAGRRAEADRLFARLLELRNDVGLLSEEWDPRARRQLGNTPQAFSHFALVVSALQLHHGRPHRSDEPIAGATR